MRAQLGEDELALVTAQDGDRGDAADGGHRVEHVLVVVGDGQRVGEHVRGCVLTGDVLAGDLCGQPGDARCDSFGEAVVLGGMGAGEGAHGADAGLVDGDEGVVVAPVVGDHGKPAQGADCFDGGLGVLVECVGVGFAEEVLDLLCQVHGIPFLFIWCGYKTDASLRGAPWVVPSENELGRLVQFRGELSALDGLQLHLGTAALAARLGEDLGAAHTGFVVETQLEHAHRRFDDAPASGDAEDSVAETALSDELDAHRFHVGDALAVPDLGGQAVVGRLVALGQIDRELLHRRVDGVHVEHGLVVVAVEHHDLATGAGAAGLVVDLGAAAARVVVETVLQRAHVGAVDAPAGRDVEEREAVVAVFDEADAVGREVGERAPVHHVGGQAVLAHLVGGGKNRHRQCADGGSGDDGRGGGADVGHVVSFGFQLRIGF